LDGGGQGVGFMWLRQGCASYAAIRIALRGVAQFFSCCLLASRCLAAEPSAPAYLFASSNYFTVLGFNLKDQHAPVAVILVNRGVGAGNATVNMAVPFKIAQSSQNEEALFRIGAFDQWTLVTYNDDLSEHWPQQVSLFAVPEIMPDPPPPNTDLRGSFYFYNVGQVWRFLYRYPDKSRPTGLPDDFFRLALRPFDAIAIAIPDNAKRLEVREKTAIPEHVFENHYARFYPAAPASASEPFLEIEYELPLNTWQSLVTEYGVEFVLVLAPLLGLALVPAKTRRRRLRTIVIVTASIIELCLLIGLIGFALWIGESGYKVIAKLALFVVSGFVALLVYLIKAESQGPQVQVVTSPPKPPVTRDHLP